MAIPSEIPIAARIKSRRLDLRLTQQEVSDNLNVERATYARWENAEISVRASDLRKLANILDVPVYYFYEEDQDEPEQDRPGERRGEAMERRGAANPLDTDRRLANIESQLQELLARFLPNEK